jgi:hypothetical protein
MVIVFVDLLILLVLLVDLIVVVLVDLLGLLIFLFGVIKNTGIHRCSLRRHIMYITVI